MAEVGLAFLSASLSVLFHKMASPEVADFMQGRKQTEKLSRKLKTAMRSVNSVLADAEEKQLTDPLVKDWVDDLKDVLFDAEDILEEIATEALQRKLDAESSTTVEKALDCISNTFLDTFVNEVEPKIEEVLDRLEDLTKQKDCMGLKVGVGGKQHPEQVLTSYVSESDTFGRNEDKKKIIDLLLSSDESGNERCVIAIVGMGGIGKTNLAQLAYNDSRVKQHFNLKIWFCVSEEFVVPNVMKSIIDQSATSSAPSTEDPEQLQVILEDNLTRKKFLLVLDDVWSEKSRHQEFLSQLLRYGTQGSKILVTTRNESVALAMKATATHHLKLLSNDDCWSLFEKHAFRDGSSNADPEIKDIGRQIVEKCKGLPLAIKAIGDLLWSESNVERWTNILKSNLWDLHMKGTDILPALRLSYKYLPSYLKRCFAYCSIFPKDYIFKKDQLVLLWMAEGFLQQSEIETMEEVGNCYFDALVSRSLFQKSLGTYESGFVMHDLVNDLANFVTGQFGFTRLKGDNSKEIRKMTRYLSYFHFHGSSDNFVKDIEEDLYKAKQLRTFLVLDCKEWNDIKMPRAQCLKVLSLSGRRQLTELFDSIGKMKHLRYLDVSYSLIKELPNSICMLYNLQTLKLSGCGKLERLPRDMWKLINLRHLEIDQTYKLKEIPIQMGRLKCLQTLSKFIVSKYDNGSSNIGELGNLINLRGKLLIEQLQNVRSAKDALDARLKDKRYFEELVLKWNPLEEVLGIWESQRGVIENLQSHEKLKSLTIKYYGGRGFPDWIGSGLHSLCRLKLMNCMYCSALPPLGQLPFLNELYIDGLNGVVTVDQEFYRNSGSLMKAFGSLKLLEFKNMSNWETWENLGAQNEVETFSQLEYLYIENCPKLRGRLPVYLHSLDKLVICNCQHLEGLLPIDSFPILTHTKITGCDNLESVVLPEQHEHDGLLSKLKILEINDCEKCELPMHQEFSSLEELYLTDCCDSLVSFPLDLFPNLKHILIKGCKNLQLLEQHGVDSAISYIKISECPKFVDFPRGLCAPNLATFSLNNCESLRSMPDKMHISLLSLRYLELKNCPEVDSFPEGRLPSNLKQIVIRRCKKLIANWKGWDLQILPSLEWLEIDGGSENVESSPWGLLLSTTLTNLKISSFRNLKSLDNEGFQHLTSIKELHLSCCPNLRYMPEEGFPTSLNFLHIHNCDPVLEEELERKEGEEWLKVARVLEIWLNVLRIQGVERFPGESPMHALMQPHESF
ncbi:putative disease resistance RPP13-like protein 1 [Carya illinoinensis]|uniref:putative disease resistance RPP13-like protein 1 n=1 Tax=Carya illinoinensis TaxID=32201 RepID=UPI001C722528|nr:putative disease resistance RPP13-like protein 1 [Carya illinoinensis]